MLMLGIRGRCSQLLVQHGPIGQPGQRIVVGHALNRRLGFLMFGAYAQVGNVICQFARQPDFGLIECVGFGGINRHSIHDHRIYA